MCRCACFFLDMFSVLNLRRGFNGTFSGAYFFGFIYRYILFSVRLNIVYRLSWPMLGLITVTLCELCDLGMMVVDEMACILLFLHLSSFLSFLSFFLTSVIYAIVVF